MSYCAKLEWAAPPQIPPCAVGEPADFRGLKINAIYDNRTRDTLDVTWKMFNESNLQTVGAERKSMIVFSGQRLPVLVPLIDAYLDHIEVAAKPDLICREGETLDCSQVVVTAFYSNKTSKEITNYKVFPFSPFELGQTDVSIRYGRSKVVLDIEVVPQNAPQHLAPTPTLEPDDAQIQAEQVDKALNNGPESLPQHLEPLSQPSEPVKTVHGVSVAKVPTHQKYLVGDTQVDLKGGRLDLIYSDGSVGQIDMMADGDVVLDSGKPGRGHVSFECLGKPVSFSVEIIEPKIIRLTIAKYPVKKDYIEGEILDLTGLVLEATYNDGSTRSIKGLQSNGFIVTKAHGEEGVTLAFENSSFTVPVHVEKEKPPVVPIGIEMSRGPNKTVYIEREIGGIDLTGTELLVQMSDGRREVVPVSSDMVQNADISCPGQVEIVIQYGSFETKCLLEVRARTLRSITLKSGPKKGSYIEHESVDLRGVILEACFDNGEREPVADYVVEPECVSTDDKELVFRYKTLSTSFPIEVQPLCITLLDWAQMPTKGVYYTQERNFSCAGGILKIKRNDGSEETVPLTKDMVSGFQTDRIGPMLLKVSYAGKSIPLTVSVEERSLLGLRVVRQPRMEYVEGEEFDPTGLVVEALYTGDTLEEVGVSYLPYGPLKADTESVMLVYQDKAVVMPIKVNPAPVPEHRPIVATTLSPTPSVTPPIVVPDNEEVEGLEEGEPEIPPDEPVNGALLGLASGQEGCSVDHEPDAAQLDIPPKKAIPVFYPSSFCIRFESDPDEIPFD